VDVASEVSGVGQFRLGGALRDDLILGMEASTWVKEYDLEVGGAKVGDAKTTFGAAVFAATWFPGNRGYFLRGGVGVASARGEVDIEVTGLLDLSLDETDRGIALLAATGYEWRLTEKFAIGPEVEVFFMGVSGDVAEDIVVVDGAVEFNWYW
jgi:hypothetical protein